MKIAITGTGSCLGSLPVTNQEFTKALFLDQHGAPFEHPNELIIEKFQAITGIAERRYAEDHLNTSDLGAMAAENALENAKIDRESLDYIIFAHNFGDVAHGQAQSDTLPSLATRVKHLLKIKNPNCVAYDLLFGCPGWIEGVVQAKAFISSGIAKKCLVIGGETLSRVVDKNDRDSMIYSDGAGACVIEQTETQGEILCHASATYANGEAYYLFYGNSYDKTQEDTTKYIKMFGRKIYEFAVTHVPQAMKDCLDKSGVSISEVQKIFIHQANEKMDEAIVKRFYKLFNQDVPEGVTPMNISTVGNNSVATVPVLYDMVRRGELQNHQLHKGDVIIFASVGAGMNINTIIYRY